MPTYDYECDGCQHKFEEFQSMKDDVLKDCPKCGQPTLRRLFGTGAAILFKGSGFYQTDYRSSSYQQAAKADQDGGAKAAPAEGGGKSGGESAGGTSKPASESGGNSPKSSS